MISTNMPWAASVENVTVATFAAAAREIEVELPKSIESDQEGDVPEDAKVWMRIDACCAE